MQHGIACLWKGIAAFLNGVVIVASAAVAGLLLYLIAARYLFGWPTVGLHEMTLIAAMWLYMVGALIASRKSEHLVVDLLPLMLKDPRKVAVQRLVVAVLTAVITGFFLFWTYSMFEWAFRRPQTMPALGLPLWVSQASMGVAALGCAAYALRDVVTAACAVFRGGARS